MGDGGRVWSRSRIPCVDDALRVALCFIVLLPVGKDEIIFIFAPH